MNILVNAPMNAPASENATFEPHYRADISQLAETLRQDHGTGALDYAVDRMHQHLRSSAWKSCALWLQIVNRLNAEPVAS